MKNVVKTFGNLNQARSAKVPLLIIALAAVIVFSMAACGGDSGGSGSGGNNDTGGGGGGGDGGMTWTAVANSTFTTDWRGLIGTIAYGNGKFVAGGSVGQMAYSTDGVTWTPVTTTAFDFVDNQGKTYKRGINAIIFANGKFVAGASDDNPSGNIIATSTDGVTWTAVASNLFGGYQYNAEYIGRWDYISSIAYGGGMFAAVSDRGRVAVSTDGITWTAKGETPINTWENRTCEIAYGSGRFVIASWEYIVTSTDGTTWTEVTNHPFYGDNYKSFYAIAYGGGRFAAVGGNSGIVAISTDGINWTKVTDTNFYNSFPGGFSRAIAIAYGGGRFIAGSNYGKMAYSTTDGATWTAISATDTTFGDKGIYAFAYDGNGTWVAVGSNGRMAYSKGN